MHFFGEEDKFFSVLGENPLKIAVTPIKQDWGRYTYGNVLRINANDSTAADQIATITRNAYTAVKRELELAAKKAGAVE